MEEKYGVLTLTTGDQYYFDPEHTIREDKVDSYKVMLFDKETKAIIGHAMARVEHTSRLIEVAPIVPV